MDFVDTPSWGLLDKCTKEQLLKIVEHYGVDVGGCNCKADIKAVWATG